MKTEVLGSENVVHLYIYIYSNMQISVFVKTALFVIFTGFNRFKAKRIEEYAY